MPLSNEGKAVIVLCHSASKSVTIIILFFSCPYPSNQFSPEPRLFLKADTKYSRKPQEPTISSPR